MNNMKTLLFLIPGVILFVAGVTFCVKPMMMFPGAETQLHNQKNKLTRLQKAIDKGKLENQKLIVDVKSMSKIRKGAISLAADGSSVLRERIDEAATKSQISIRTVGDIQRRIVLDESVMLYEVNFTAECNLKEFISLTREFENKIPRIYWKTLTLRPNISHKNNGLLFLSGNVVLLALGACDE